MPKFKIGCDFCDVTQKFLKRLQCFPNAWVISEPIWFFKIQNREDNYDIRDSSDIEYLY